MKCRIAHEVRARIRFQIEERLAPGELYDIDFALKDIKGVRDVRFSPRTLSVIVHYDGSEMTRLSLLDALESLTTSRPKHTKGSEHASELITKRNELLRSLIFSALGQTLGGVPKAAFSLHGTLPFINKGIASAVAGRMDADLLDAAAIGATLKMGDLKTGSLITLLLRVGEYLRLRTEFRARRDLAQTLNREKRDVWVKRNGVESCIPDREVRIGDVVVVRAGHVLPVDGVIVSGRAMIDQSSLTGESQPVLKRKTAMVYEGTLLIEGEIEVEARMIGDDTRIAKIVRIIDQAESQKADAQDQAAQLADKLVPFVFSVAGLAQIATRDSNRAASVLLVDYSCALKLCVPLAIRTCMMESLANGILVRGGKFLERLAETDTFVFDKTGTLTEAKPKVVELIIIGDHDRAELLTDAACVEEHFPHPVAAAILREAERHGLAHREEEHGQVKYLVAQGIVSTVRGRRFVIGSRRFLERNEVLLDGVEQAAQREGYSMVYVGVDNRLAGIFVVDDPVRAEAHEMIAALRKLGIKRLILLTGDGPSNARRVAETLGFDEFHAEVSPEEKAVVMKELKSKGYKVAMTGDGLNDAPALALADVGISFQHGADLARETADVVILRQDLRCIPTAVTLARLAKARVNRNFRDIVGINTALIASALLGSASPAKSAMFHNLTTVYTSLRSLRSYLPKNTGA